MKDLATVIITTYKRPDCLEKCYDSVRKYWKGPILVQDTEGNLSKGRNTAIKIVNTPFFFLMEDDMEFIENTNIESLHEVLYYDTTVGGVSPWLIQKENNFAHNFKLVNGKLESYPSEWAKRRTSGGCVYQMCEMIANCGLFRTEIAEAYPWNEKLELFEHREWFWRLRAECFFALTRGCEVVHHHSRPSEEYIREREGRQQIFRKKAEQELGFRLGNINGGYSFG